MKLRKKDGIGLNMAMDFGEMLAKTVVFLGRN